MPRKWIGGFTNSPLFTRAARTRFVFSRRRPGAVESVLLHVCIRTIDKYSWVKRPRVSKYDNFSERLLHEKSFSREIYQLLRMNENNTHIHKDVYMYAYRFKIFLHLYALKYHRSAILYGLCAQSYFSFQGIFA